MENSSSVLATAIISFFVYNLMLSSCEGATMVVDGVSQWSNPTANIGDSIIFKHEGGEEKYRLYIFRSELAFKSCDFTQATLLSDSNNSTAYTWRPSRPGLFYFSFNNGTSIPCQQGQKLAIKVTPTSSSSPSPSPSPLPSLLSAPTPAILPSPTPAAETTTAPPPTSGGNVGGNSGGGVVSSSPAYPWPFQPREKSAGGPTTASIGSGSPIGLDDKGGEGSTPFINSNPAVPLPTGEIDSATYRPLPTSTHSGSSSNSAGEIVRLPAAVILTIISCSVFFLLWL